MWPFSSNEKSEVTEYCDGQVNHEYETIEEIEIVSVEKHYDPREEAFVVILRTIPKLAECTICGNEIKNDVAHWDTRQSLTSYTDYTEKLTKVIVDDCSDAERKSISEEELIE